MSMYLVDSTDMTAIADAIRQKDGTQTTMTVSQMPTRINNIPSGGTDYMEERVQGTLSSYTIPSTCTQISAYAFYGMPLTSITIPSSVTSIGDYAFRNCQLTSLFLPRTLTYLGQYAFYGQHDTSWHNNTLTSVTFDDNINLNCFVAAFSENHSLTTVNNFKVENFLYRTIVQAMFDNSALVGDISLGDSATVGQRAFRNSNSSGILYIHLTQTDSSLLTTSYSFGPGTTSTNKSFDFDHCRLVVPVGMLSDYQSAFPNYSSIMMEETT